MEERNLAKVKSKIKRNRIFLKLFTKILIKKAIMLPIIPSAIKQKTSYNFNNFYINNFKNSFKTYILYLTSGLILRKLSY